MAYYYYQLHGGEEDWEALPIKMRAEHESAKQPRYYTALSVSAMVTKEMSSEDKDKLKYDGPLYFDWDARGDIEFATEQTIKLLTNLEEMGVDMAAVSIYATGGKGYHAEIPQAVFMEKPQPVPFLPTIYREIALKLAVDSLDLRVYSRGRGRMWRTPNVKRENGAYKVPITWAELKAMTPERYAELCSAPRHLPPPAKPTQAIKLTIMFDEASQTIKQKMAAKKKKKGPDIEAIRASKMPSLDALMAGRGIKSGVGFHPIAMQLAIVADTMGWSETQLVEKSQGLIESHQGDGDRYNSPDKRARELERMFRYMNDNPCYDFSVGALKGMMSHEAPDLDGIPISAAEVDENIEKAKNAPPPDETPAEFEQDAYGDIARGLDMTKYGIYIQTDDGKKRICAISFDDVEILRDVKSGNVSCYTADVLVNGKNIGRQTLELETFSGLQAFNRFAMRMGHAMQGADQHVRALMLRIAQKATTGGRVRYIAAREGLDVVNIPGHENPELHKPFLIWADTNNVFMEARAAATGVEMSFLGHPDPRGVFRTDLSDAPELGDWVKTESKDHFRHALHSLIGCQRPEVIGNFLGWYTACFYRMLFNKAYDKFPLLHVTGHAGAGKSFCRDTPVLRASGETAMIQDIRVGDQLLGPDGGVRNVLALGQGREKMYRVVPVKGDPYIVNESHILSLRKSGKQAQWLCGGTLYVPADAEDIVVNIPLKDYLAAWPTQQKDLKGWRSSGVEFHRSAAPQPLDPYWLGCWLGDGSATAPTLYKPACNMTRWWVQHAESKGHRVTEYERLTAKCSNWAIVGDSSSDEQSERNFFTAGLQSLGLIKNKHVPAAYKYGSTEVRLQVIAGLLDSDGHLTHSGYDWISKDKQMADDMAFMCRSVGLAAYVKPSIKGIKSIGFSDTYWRCSISGDCDRIPCLDKKAAPRCQIKRHLVHGISVEPLEEDDYYGVVLDGDHLFLLGDFTTVHNTEMNRSLLSMFYYHQTPKELTPQSSIFAIQQHLAGSSSIPLMIDEYKPAEMSPELHNKLKLLWRDAYNNREITKGGGNRDSEDFRSLNLTQISAPIVFISEAMEDEPATMERVVLVSVVRPVPEQAQKWHAKFQEFQAHKHHLGVLGQYIAANVVFDYSIEQLRIEFDELYLAAQQKYMLTSADLEAGLSPEVLRIKQGAKQRTVYNFCVSQFGLQKFKVLIDKIYGPDEFAESFETLENAIFSKMADLLPATQAEYLKVINQLASMSFENVDSPSALIKGFHYAKIDFGGKEAIEFGMRACYSRYRVHCKNINVKPLFTGEPAFIHAMKDSNALLSRNATSQTIQSPGGTFVFDMSELRKMGVEDFRN